MAKIVVLFNLKEGIDPAVYEEWALNTDIPTVGGLKTVDNFEVFAVSGLLDGSPSPYRYVEIIDTRDMDAFVAEVSTELMQRIAAEFQSFADNPMFMVSEPIGKGE